MPDVSPPHPTTPPTEDWRTQWADWDADPRQFASFQQWVNKASSWVAGGTCVDATGRVLRIGADFMTATFPVTIFRRRSGSH